MTSLLKMGDKQVGTLDACQRGEWRERDPKPYLFKQGEKAHGKTKQIGTYHGMGNGRKRMYSACPDVVAAEQPIG